MSLARGKDGRYLYSKLYIMQLTKLRSRPIFLYSSSLYLVMKYLNPEHSVQNVFFLKYRIKCFVIYAQVSFSSQGPE
jgi:hypothetical protein